jgi:hypothetical protein
MSTKEIKENLKNSIDKLSAADIKLAANDLNLYFEYLQARSEMPRHKKLTFEQYQQLMRSLGQAEKGKLITAAKVFSAIKKKYGFRG